MGVLSNKISRDELRAGDHIYSWRCAYIYAHHGIYAGEDKVIHFTQAARQGSGGTGTVLNRIQFSSSPNISHNPCPCCGDQSSLDGVISSCIECFLSGGDLYLFQYGVSLAFFFAQVRGGTCTLAKSVGAEEVLQRASFLLVKGFGIYHVFNNNCTDFAMYCKTGLQVNTSISGGRIEQVASVLEAASSTVSTASFIVSKASSTVSKASSTVSKARFIVSKASSLISTPQRYMTASIGGIAVAGTGIAVVGCGIVAVGCGIYCVSRLVSDMGVRCDVEKVAVENVSGTKADEGEASSISEIARADEGGASSNIESVRADEGEASSSIESAKADEGEASSSSESAKTK